MQRLDPEKKAVDGNAFVVAVDPGHEFRKIFDRGHGVETISDCPSVSKTPRVGGPGQHGGNHFGFRIHAFQDSVESLIEGVI